jgi:hypothetical protein
MRFIGSRFRLELHVICSIFSRLHALSPRIAARSASLKCVGIASSLALPHGVIQSHHVVIRQVCTILGPGQC